MLLTLSQTQKRIYDLLYRGMQAGKYTVELPAAFPRDSILLMIKLILGEHPELVIYDNCYVRFSTYGSVTTVELQPAFKTGGVATARANFEAKVNAILKAIVKPGASPIQKVLAIHDYMVANVVYDYDDSSGKVPYIFSHTAYGAIMHGKAVCEGIACAFSLLAQRAGIETTVVNGVVEDGEHSWNLIRVDGEYYHMDVTWDIRKQANPKVKIYDHFCLCDRDLRHRNWDKKIYPPCTATRYNYFNVTRTLVHDRQQLRALMARQFKKYGALYFRYDFLQLSEQAACDYFWEEFVSVAREYGLRVGEVRYTINTDLGIFNLYSV